MHRLNLAQANALIEAALARGAELGLKPLTVTIHDPGAYLIACQRQDGASNMRVKLAGGKAAGALALGVSSRTIGDMAVDRPHFIAAVDTMSEGGMVPAAGGVIICDAGGTVVGAIGVTGDTSDNDEACALAAIEAVGLRAKN
ncbi:GlcG/HbpS family heme-binding protein [Altererythrobacter sp. Root672]|uniref:GlcG/HbpS family heme-binding protein n=1 Tax=Altererythrobacter sp. Root672 TaxID=1736584 RepID=UPI0006F653BA|nr:heme-binding protein [Altererythrobacter sp. Root672]KRA79755.1 GlcG protein [Altererythrobacter sp. Root672]